MDADPDRLANRVREVEGAINRAGFVCKVEDVNAVEAWIGSLPGQAYALQVQRVTPVSVTEDGRNYFRVEARLSDDALRQAGKMRPGMEGVAKIEAGRRSLLWIWTHRLLDWARLKAWEWML